MVTYGSFQILNGALGKSNFLTCVLVSLAPSLSHQERGLESCLDVLRVAKDPVSCLGQKYTWVLIQYRDSERERVGERVS